MENLGTLRVTHVKLMEKFWYILFLNTVIPSIKKVIAAFLIIILKNSKKVEPKPNKKWIYRFFSNNLINFWESEPQKILIFLFLTPIRGFSGEVDSLIVGIKKWNSILKLKNRNKLKLFIFAAKLLYWKKKLYPL